MTDILSVGAMAPGPQARRRPSPRKLVVSMNLSLDGFLAGPRGELDWHLERWSSEMAEAAARQLAAADTILLGRRTYEAFAAYWPSRLLDLSYSRADIAFAHMMNSHRKLVFSRTLQATAWQHAELARRSPQAEVRALRGAPGPDIILFGSGSLAATLAAARLVDEYLLWIHPLALGRGRPLFAALRQRQTLKLLGSHVFATGVVLLRYGACAGPACGPEDSPAAGTSCW